MGKSKLRGPEGNQPPALAPLGFPLCQPLHPRPTPEPLLLGSHKGQPPAPRRTAVNTPPRPRLGPSPPWPPLRSRDEEGETPPDSPPPLLLSPSRLSDRNRNGFRPQPGDGRGRVTSAPRCRPLQGKESGGLELGVGKAGGTEGEGLPTGCQVHLRRPPRPRPPKPLRRRGLEPEAAPRPRGAVKRTR